MDRSTTRLTAVSLAADSSTALIRQLSDATDRRLCAGRPASARTHKRRSRLTSFSRPSSNKVLKVDSSFHNANTVRVFGGRAVNSDSDPTHKDRGTAPNLTTTPPCDKPVSF